MPATKTTITIGDQNVTLDDFPGIPAKGMTLTIADKTYKMTGDPVVVRQTPADDKPYYEATITAKEA